MPSALDASPTQLPNPAANWPHPPTAPLWMVWTPWAAIAWALAYGAVRVQWAVHGAPSFGPKNTDLIVFTGWGAVSLCAAATAVALALRTMRWHLPLFVAGCTVCLSLLAACPLLLLDAVGGLLPGIGIQFYPAAFLSRAGCFVLGLLIGASTVAYRRRWRALCMFCGRSSHRTQPKETPRWAFWAAYATILGCLARLAAQIAIGFGMIQRHPGPQFAIETTIFEAAFLLAGTVLPLSLVHSWGRIVPRWIPFLAGRRIPRWLPLGPAIVIGPLITVYFGFTLTIITIGTITGREHEIFGPFPAAFFWVAVPGYLVWGIGLTSAAVAYHRVTRPACKICGRQ